MKKYYNVLTTCLLLAVVLGLMVSVEAAREPNQAATAGTEQRPAVRPAGWAAYKVIVERNMFSRQRGTRRARSDDRGTLPPPPAPESYYVLRGTVQEDNAFICFIEDTRRGDILRIRKGDSVARGVVKDLSLDSIEYQFEDRTITVTMGQDLEGGQGAVTMTELYELSQTYSTTPQETTTEPSSPSEDEAEILKKLMERRKQQLGQ